MDIYTYLNSRCAREDYNYYKNVYPNLIAVANDQCTPLHEIHGYEGKVGVPPSVRWSRTPKMSKKREDSERDESESEENTSDIDSESDSASDVDGSESHSE